MPLKTKQPNDNSKNPKKNKKEEQTEEIEPQIDSKKLEKHKKVGKLLCEQILEKLGTPTFKFKIESKHLWHTRYRINIRKIIGDTILDTKIIHSYFVVGTEDGLIKSEPEIIKKYEVEPNEKIK